jgi:hypothetical protein
MGVLWFRLPHLPEGVDAPGGAFGGFARGHILDAFDQVFRAAILHVERRVVMGFEPVQL